MGQRVFGLLIIGLLLSSQAMAGKYIKVSNSGQALPDSAQLGAGPNDWACTYDTETKLLWEVKTDDGGLRDKDWGYTWYDPNPATNGGEAGKQNGGACQGSRCDTQSYVEAVNAQGLCGGKDWRLPTIAELRSLIYCSSGLGDVLSEDNQGCQGSYQRPTIDTHYFPNTLADGFWSAANTISYAWGLNFGNGNDGWGFQELCHSGSCCARGTVL